jgi:hypothetical protein
MRLTDHPSGDYRFLPGIAPDSCGAVSKAARAGFVMDLMEDRLRGLSGDWPAVTATDV